MRSTLARDAPGRPRPRTASVSYFARAAGPPYREVTVGNKLAHQPVMPSEVLAALQPGAAGVYLDATFGRGGHSALLLGKLGPKGSLFALDRDPEAVAAGRERFDDDERFRIEQGSFAQLARWAASWGIAGRVDGVLMDLGVSSPQLDDAERGFSFSADGPLDMRFDPSTGESAADWLERATEEQIRQVLSEYGEERFAHRIARAIVTARRQAPIATTGRLAEIVASAVPRREPGKHPATRTFQALRIRVNDELDALQSALRQAVEVLAPGGRLAVISFHSLEDRLVKRFFRDAAGRAPRPGRGLPLPEEPKAVLKLVGGAQRPGEEEVDRNPRARSAVLRVAERRRS